MTELSSQLIDQESNLNLETRAYEAKEKGDYLLAKDLWQQCIVQLNNKLQYWLELAITQRKCNEYSLSLETLQQTEHQHGKDCWIEDNRARAYLALGQIDLAIIHWKTADSLTNDSNYKNLFQQEIKNCEQKLEAINFAAVLNEIKELLQRGDLINIVKLIESDSRITFKDENQADQIAALLKQFNATQQILQLWQRFVKKTPKLRQPYLKLAIAYRENGEYDHSREVLREMQEQFGTDCWIEDNLARLCVLQGNRRHAESHWSEAARIAPDPRWRTEFENLVKRSREHVGVTMHDGLIEFCFPTSQSPETVVLAIDGKRWPDVQWAQLRNDQNQTYRLTTRIPTQYLDGEPHVYEACDIGTSTVLGVDAFIVPPIATPWTALLKYSRAPFPGHLSPLARDRYRSLQAWLQQANKWPAGDSFSLVQQLAIAHEILLSGNEQPRINFSPLVFPVHNEPQVSIIIPVHNHFALTYSCLAALIFAFTRISFEIIIVDDGSEDQTEQQLLKLITGITCIRHNYAHGFVGACNEGAQHAKGEYLVLLNNDTEPTAYWLDEMLHVFKHGDSIGIVGAKLVYPDGRLQEAGGIVWSNGDPWNYGRGGNPHDPRYNYTREVDYVSGAALMIPRTLWESIGGFNPNYAPAYFEDTDLAFQVKKRDLRIVYAPLAKIYHFEGQSCGTDTNNSSGLKRFQEINRPKFKYTHAALFRGHGAVGITPDLEKDRGIKIRVLVIDAETPQPDRDAGSYAAIQEIRLMQSFGIKITFIPMNLAYLGYYTENLQRHGIEVLYSPFVTSIEEILRLRGAEFQAVYITRYYVAKEVLSLVRTHLPQAKILFCNADLHFLRQLRAAIAAGKDPELLKEVTRTRDEELAVIRSVDVTLSYNHIEHAVILSHNLDHTNVTLCPWVVEPVPRIVPFEERSGIAYLGNYRHPPNFDAVTFFAREVLPLLRAQDPTLCFRVYGSNVDQQLKDLAEDIPGLELIGYVDDVNQVYDTCRVFVAPLRSGAGIKGKVIGALAHGLPQVLSPIAAEGIRLRDGLEVRIAETPAQWCEAVLTLHNDPKIWNCLSQAALEYAQINFSFARGRILMQNALAKAEIYVTPADRGIFVN